MKEQGYVSNKEPIASLREQIELAPKASYIGINLDEMTGLGPPYRSWDDVEDDIKPLLNHSDCDGELTVEECGMIGERIFDLIKDWPDDINKWKLIWLANIMENHYFNDEPLIFT